jgi:hypothetical protein
MGHDEPSFVFSMLSAFFAPILLMVAMLFGYKSFYGTSKMHQQEALKETNAILREILAELKNMPKT